MREVFREYQDQHTRQSQIRQRNPFESSTRSPSLGEFLHDHGGESQSLTRSCPRNRAFAALIVLSLKFAHAHRSACRSGSRICCRRLVVRKTGPPRFRAISASFGVAFTTAGYPTDASIQRSCSLSS